MIIISSAKMGNGTFQAKYEPILKLDYVEKIYVLRKEAGPSIDKLEYIILPKICKNFIFNLIIAPILLSYYTIKLKADLILVYHFIPHAFFGYISHFLSGKPYIIGQTGLDIQKFAKKRGLKGIIKFIARKAYHLNVPGSQSFNFWTSNGIVKEKVKILHSTIDTDYFVSENIAPEYDFIYLGRLAPVKRIHLIIDAFEKLKLNGVRSKMVIVGDGEEKENLINLVKKKSLQNQIDFVGFQLDTKRWFNKANISVMASESEGLPTSLMQAMACERICISSDAGNIPDLIENEVNGFIFKVSESDKLAGLMENALNHNTCDQNLTKNARERIIKHHSYLSATKKWNQILMIINKES